MSAATRSREATIEADPDIPVITITREFDAGPDRVYRAWAEPDLVRQWMGPRSVAMDIETWECRTGGRYRYRATRGEEGWTFFGSFHEARPGERLVQTFTWDGEPDGVALETLTFEPLDDGRRCRVVAVSVTQSMQAQRAMMTSGMDVGVNEGYEKLDELLAAGAV